MLNFAKISSFVHRISQKPLEGPLCVPHATVDLYQAVTLLFELVALSRSEHTCGDQCRCEILAELILVLSHLPLGSTDTPRPENRPASTDNWDAWIKICQVAHGKRFPKAATSNSPSTVSWPRHQGNCLAWNQVSAAKVELYNS